MGKEGRRVRGGGGGGAGGPGCVQRELSALDMSTKMISAPGITHDVSDRARPPLQFSPAYTGDKPYRPAPTHNVPPSLSPPPSPAPSASPLPAQLPVPDKRSPHMPPVCVRTTARYPRSAVVAAPPRPATACLPSSARGPSCTTWQDTRTHLASH